MDILKLLNLIKNGEDSRTRFKIKFKSMISLAVEIGVFANSKGGRIIVGVDDDGAIIGLTKDEVKDLNQMVSNVCSQKIDPSISVITENVKCDEKIVMVINVPMGANKFYISNGKDIWVKVGSDKRRAKGSCKIIKALTA